MRLIAAMTAPVAAASVLLAACAGGDRATVPRASAGGGASCAAVEGRNEPFIVDWRADERIDVEAALTRSIVVVSFECQRMRVLTDCTAAGTYRYVGVTQKEQLIRIDSSDALHANLPLGDNAIAKNLGAAIEHGSTVDIALLLVGKTTSSRPWVLKRELKGECAGATHFVRSATLGAFALTSGTRAKAQSPIDILGPSKAGSSSDVIHNRDGEIDACRAATPDGETPPRQCSTPLRLELRALGAAIPSASEDESDDVLRCPRGLVLDETSICVTPRSSTPHICRPEEPSDCALQCEKGSRTSCAILGRAYMIGRGVPRDLVKARSLFEPACKQGVAPACGRLGELALAEKKTDEGARLLNDACSAGFFTACEPLARLTISLPDGVKMDPFATFQRSCRAGDPDGCWGVGSLFAKGVGVRANDREAMRWFREACTAGAKLGCSSYAKLIDEGRGGGDPDPVAAVAILQPSCEHGYSHACSTLSSFYFAGRGVAKDVGKGMELLTRACEGRDRASCTSLATRYAAGTGVPKDEARSRKYLVRACEAGEEPACAQAQGTAPAP